MTTGYSGKPLSQKLGIKPDHRLTENRVREIGLPTGWVELDSSLDELRS